MTPEEKLFEEWKQKFMAVIRQEARAQGWLNNASHLHPAKYTEIGDRVLHWMKINPAPPNPHAKLPKLPHAHVPPAGPSVHGVGNMNNKVDHAIMAYRNFRPRGVSSLETLVLLGGMTAAGIALKVGIFAAKWAIEDKMWELADRHFINPALTAVSYARIPQTRAQLDYYYMNYCDTSIGRVANYGLTPKLMSKEDWCWQEYGIDMSVLK